MTMPKISVHEFVAKLKRVRIHRLVGRCRRCRNVSAHLRGTWEKIVGPPAKALVPSVSKTISVIPPDVGIALRTQGYVAGFRLSRAAVGKIARYARGTPCFHSWRDPERFLIGEVRDGHSPQGHPVAVADVTVSPQPRVLDEVSLDAALVRLARDFLGYAPTSVATRLYWSPVSTLGADERRANGQTIDFHYDVERSQSLYLFFYITPVDARSGAHVVIPGSHRSKPLSMAITSAFPPTRRIEAVYSADAPRIIEGPSGFGFAEDPLCFHKVLVPKGANRLVLQLRYS